MSANLFLYSSHLISQEEFASVLQEVGGFLTPEETFEARISDTHSHLWLTHEAVDWFLKANEESQRELFQQVRALLGGELQIVLDLILSSTPGTQRLAVRFAYACSRRWPCVIDDDYGKLFTREDIERLYEEGGGFTTYGLDDDWN